MHYLILALRTPEFDSAILPGHQAYLDELRERGALEVCGPFTDQSGGAYVVRADSLAQAEAIAAADPLGSSGASELAVWAWELSWVEPRRDAGE